MAASLLGLLAGGCDVYVRPPDGGEVVVAGPPPEAPPVVEVQTASPGPDYIWIGGAWTWRGNSWAWERGRWDRPPHPGAHWTVNHYEERGGRRVFVRGGWR
jgi:hypothetical protein